MNARLYSFDKVNHFLYVIRHAEIFHAENETIIMSQLMITCL